MTTSTILVLNASGRYAGSVTRNLADKLATELNRTTGLPIVNRDLAKGITVIDENWIAANFTDEQQRSPEQKQSLAFSDSLVTELQQARHLIIATPIYNFGVPSVVKAWVDQIARARITFRYTETGPVGLLEDTQAHLVMASGGVPIGSEMDFATGYLQFILGFVGIKDVTVLNGNELSQITDTAVLQAEIETLTANVEAV